MINPLYWPRYLRISRAIVDYPQYDVPHKQAEGTLPKDQIDENFAYFMAVRLQRLSFFQNWLSDEYRLRVAPSGEGVLALEKWADQYAGGLIPTVNDRESAAVFTTYQPNWTGDWRGYNVLVDIAIFIGEFLISKRPHLHWKLLADDDGGFADSDEGEGIGATLGRPELGGYCLHRWTPNLFQSVYLKALSCRNKLELSGKHLPKIHVSLASICRESLHVATHRDPRATFTFGDYSHGPF